MTPVIARCFERTVYHHYSKKVFEENLTVTQYAYREGCSCTDALIQIQYNYLKALDDKDCNYAKFCVFIIIHQGSPLGFYCRAKLSYFL